MSDLTLLILLKVAYLGCGLVLCLIGKGLIERKLKAKFESEGSVGNSTFKVVSTSPGLIFLTAGFFAIGAAIFQEFELVDSNTDSSMVSADPSSDSTAKISKLVERVRTIRFADADSSESSVESAVAFATRFAASGDIERASVYAAMAIVASPGSLAQFHEDSVFEQVLENPHLRNIIQARFELPIFQPQTSSNHLSPVAEHVLSRLQSLGKLESPATDRIGQAAKLSEAIPDTADTQGEEISLDQLMQVLELSASVLLNELRKPQRSWILENDKILTELELAVDARMRNY